MGESFCFTVNGVERCTSEDKPLLRYLRDDLHLHSVKDGCSEGACGTCTIVVDGKAVKSCVLTTRRAVGKNIITTEGLSDAEKEAFVYAFGAMGSVQCGFCTPGMVMAGKALIDRVPDPTEEEIKVALKGNICRCTGYKKIEDAILMAADFFREKREVPGAEEDGGITRRFKRVDAEEKVRGTGKYVDDIVLPDMAYAKALRSPYPRCRINGIHIEKALAHPDCVAVYTAEDVPENICGHIKKDWDVMIPVGGITRYVGDALALAVVNHKENLDEVLSLIELDAEELQPVTDPRKALEEDAPRVHEEGNLLAKKQCIRGDADTAIKNSKYVVTRHYSLPFTDHAFMEPECAIAFPEGEDGVHLYTSGQSVYDEQREISGILQIPQEKVVVESMLVGGGFGGKEDMSVQHHAALCAWLLKRPVKVRFSRAESLMCHVKRHAMEMDFTTACDENGYLTGMKAVLYADTGAYASLGSPVLERACTHAAGPYNYQDVEIIGYGVYTNNIPAGAYRGFGVTQSCFATEFNLDLLAEQVGITPWEIRYRNAIRPGQTLPNGQIATPDCALAQTLEAVKEVYDSHPYAGIASCMKNSGIGVGNPDVGRCNLRIRDGKVQVLTSAACMGQGVGTVAIQIVCETTGLKADQVTHKKANTIDTPDSGTSTASRQTLFTGEATRRAALQLKDALQDKGSLEALEGEEFYAEYTGETDAMGSPKEHPVSHIAYGYATQVVILDESGKVTEVVAAHDVGTVINVQSCEGQVEGGVVMGLGYAFTEDFPMVDGRPVLSYGKLGLFRATAAPDIKTILVTSPEVLTEAYGAKGVGEISTVPTAPACAHAYYRLDGAERRKLPLENTFYRKEKKKG